jgi:hypothetical protein
MRRKNPAAVALAKRRARSMTKEQRSESARKAGIASAIVRWGADSIKKKPAAEKVAKSA